MHAYERWYVRSCLALALKSPRLARPPKPECDLLSWVGTYSRVLALPPLEFEEAEIRAGIHRGGGKELRNWQTWRKALIKSCAVDPPAPSRLQRRLSWLASLCELTPPQIECLALLTWIATSRAVSDLADALLDRLGLDMPITEASEVSQLLSSSSARFELRPGGHLYRMGLIEDESGLKTASVLRRALSLPRLNRRTLLSLLIGPAAVPSLSWEEFAHLGETAALGARIVKAASKSETQIGVNLLLYGPPGTGKTEFAKTLGHRAGLAVHFIGEANGDSKEPSRSDRLAALLMASAAGGLKRQVVLVVDEADDLFVGVDDDDAASRTGSKVFINRLLEKSTSTIVWIVNEERRLGSAALRRMTLSIRFPKPSVGVRSRIVKRVAKALDFELKEDEAAGLATFGASPSDIATAIRAASLISAGPKAAGNILEQNIRALGGTHHRPAPSPVVFDPTLSTADVDLLSLADKLAHSRATVVSFCLSGPPGTGKSAYACYLAARMELDVLEKRYSDVASMFVGGTEKSISRAFEEAADTRAFLILNEVDSLLRDRRMSHHSWEVTQANEMLTQMERHPFPFACTTNALDLIDVAAARRFTFKVQFSPMTRQQIAAAFRRYFVHDAPSVVVELTGVTPGDFATVARKAAALGEKDPRVLSQWLENEALAKRAAGSRRIGF